MAVGCPPFVRAAKSDKLYRFLNHGKRNELFWKYHPSRENTDNFKTLSPELKKLIEALLSPFPCQRPSLTDLIESSEFPWMSETFFQLDNEDLKQ